MINAANAFAQARENAHGIKLANDKLNAIINALGITFATGPAVDFIVDNFDRADADTLGAYWGNSTQWALRNGRALPVSTSFSPGVVGSATAMSTYNQATVQTNVYPDLRPYKRASARYAATMSSGAFSVAVDFDIAAPAFAHTGTTLQEGYALASLAGVSVSAGGVAEEVLIAAGSAPALSITAQSGADFAAASSPAFVASSCTFGNGAGAASPLDVSSVNATLNSSTSGSSTSPIPASQYLVTGNNRLLMTVNGNSVTIALNGHTIYSGSPGYLMQPQQVGISASGYSLISAMAELNTALAAVGGPALHTYAGIFRFKAWVSTVSEPPDTQSGHGVHDANYPGGILWADKYHSFLKDGSGNVTGYSYNPAA